MHTLFIVIPLLLFVPEVYAAKGKGKQVMKASKTNVKDRLDLATTTERKQPDLVHTSNSSAWEVEALRATCKKLRQERDLLARQIKSSSTDDSGTSSAGQSSPESGTTTAINQEEVAVLLCLAEEEDILPPAQTLVTTTPIDIIPRASSAITVSTTVISPETVARSLDYYSSPCGSGRSLGWGFNDPIWGKISDNNVMHSLVPYYSPNFP